MKRFLFTMLISYLLVNSEAIYAQTNLVENPSFEIFDTCPKLQWEIRYAVGWNSFNQTPDYFNACSTNPQFSTPNNWGGYQQPASGVAYSGFGAYVSHVYSGINQREFIGGTLTASLLRGTKYFVSFKVSPSVSNQILSNCAIDHIGAVFSTKPYTWNLPAPITNNPQVYEKTIITDTANWTRIFGSFIADSSYNYVIIGNFFDDSHTDTLMLHGNDTCFAYYYLDDVCVSTDSTYTANYTTAIDEIQSKKATINIYPNPAHNYFTVDFPDNNEPYEIIISDIMGQELYRKNNITATRTQFDISAYNQNILINSSILNS